jgi:hypothetical protein
VTNHFFFFLKVIIRRRRREEKMISQWDEHLFWLERLQDHAYFVRDALSPAELECYYEPRLQAPFKNCSLTNHPLCKAMLQGRVNF